MNVNLEKLGYSISLKFKTNKREVFIKELDYINENSKKKINYKIWFMMLEAVGVIKKSYYPQKEKAEFFSYVNVNKKVRPILSFLENRNIIFRNENHKGWAKSITI